MVGLWKQIDGKLWESSEFCICLKEFFEAAGTKGHSMNIRIFLRVRPDYRKCHEKTFIKQNLIQKTDNVEDCHKVELTSQHG